MAKSKKRNGRNGTSGGNGGGRRQISAPISSGFLDGKSTIKFSNGPDGSVQVRHREYVGEVLGSIAFAWDSYPINPGLETTFPWLWPIACRFESYRFESLRFDFEPACPTSTEGSVLLVVDYDAADVGPDSKAVAMGYASSVRSPAWGKCSHVSRKSDLSKHVTWNTRFGVVGSQDIKTTDIGNLFVCADGQAADGGTLGELYVEYVVNLYTPQIEEFVGGQADYLTTSWTNGAVFGTVPTDLALTTGVPIVENQGSGILKFLRNFEGLINARWATGTTAAVPTIDTVNTSADKADIIQSSTTGVPVIMQTLSVAAQKNQTLALDMSAATGPLQGNFLFSPYEAY